MLGFKAGLLGVALLAQAAASAGCSDSDSIQNSQQEQSNLQAVQEVGFPAITQFAEKRQLKMIYELRDKAIATNTYIVDMNGHYHKVCSSFGYGIPYSTQFTNPESYHGNGVVLPQADPNGLFSPASADGTWVVCLNPKTKQIAPAYIEPRVVVLPASMPDPGN